MLFFVRVCDIRVCSQGKFTPILLPPSRLIIVSFLFRFRYQMTSIIYFDFFICLSTL